MARAAEGNRAERGFFQQRKRRREQAKCFSTRGRGPRRCGPIRGGRGFFYHREQSRALTGESGCAAEARAAVLGRAVSAGFSNDANHAASLLDGAPLAAEARAAAPPRKSEDRSGTWLVDSSSRHGIIGPILPS